MLKRDRVAIFIDGPNLYATTKQLGFDIDFQKLRALFGTTLQRAYYFTGVMPPGDPSGLRKLIDHLDYNGYAMITKTVKNHINSRGEAVIKGNMDIEIAINMIRCADQVERLVLFSGDGDFAPLVKDCQDRGAHVTVVSTIETQPHMIADELRRQADVFSELKAWREKIERDRDAQAA